MQRLVGEADHDLQHVAHAMIQLGDQHALLLFRGDDFG